MVKEIARLLLAIGALALTGYWAVTNSGLFGLLAGAQAELLGAYYPVITGFVTLIVVLVPVIVVSQFLKPKLDQARIQSFCADPLATLTGGPVVLGVASLIGWPKAGVTATVTGVELTRGDRTVLLPWTLFAVQGVALQRSPDKVLLPIDGHGLSAVALLRGGAEVARGSAAIAPFLAWHGAAVELCLELPLEPAAFGEIVLQVGRVRAGWS